MLISSPSNVNGVSFVFISFVFSSIPKICASLKICIPNLVHSEVINLIALRKELSFLQMKHVNIVSSISEYLMVKLAPLW